MRREQANYGNIHVENAVGAAAVASSGRLRPLLLSFVSLLILVASCCDPQSGRVQRREQARGDRSVRESGVRLRLRLSMSQHGGSGRGRGGVCCRRRHRNSPNRSRSRRPGP